MRKIISILILTVLLVGCSKAPSHVISEGDMADLMVDLYKAESIIEDNVNTYRDDSLKMTVRQSVMMKHGITQAQLDTSLIWYSHNLDVYKEVYKDIIAQLEDEQRELSKSDFTSVSIVASSDIKPSEPRYREVGDTADIWGRSRTWVLLPGFADNMITFDIAPDKESAKGDRYEWAFKVNNYRKTLKSQLCVDYNDGSREFVYQTISKDGWNHIKLQSDSTRDVKRIYGYISTKSSGNHVIFIDSIELLRTHLDTVTYSNILKAKRWYDRKNALPSDSLLKLKKDKEKKDKKKILKKGQIKKLNTEKAKETSLHR